MNRVLVTGAAGQVGSRLVRQLLKRNCEVKGLLLPDDPAAERIDGLDVEGLEGDLLDPEVAKQAVQDVDGVVHTANLVGRPKGMTESDFFVNNVQTTFNISQAAAQQADRIERFVCISSSAVYPNDTQEIAACYFPIDENHPKRPMGTYPISKYLGEHIVNGHAQETGLQTALVRPSGICSGTAILGRWTVGSVCRIAQIGQRHPKSMLYMEDGTECWKELEAAASPDTLCAVTDEQGRPWLQQPVDARDVAALCVCALESGAAIGEAFNASAPVPIPYPEAAAIIAEATGKDVIEWKLPVRWVFDLDNTKARSLIGFKPAWGIREMVRSALAVQNEGATDYE